MLANFINVFRIPELRRKVLFTLMILGVYRVGAHITVPFVDTAAMESLWSRTGAGGGIFDMVNMFSGMAFKRITIFALGIMPYITSSIILQMLMVVWPRLEKIAKEGQAGQKKINQYTRYGSVLVTLFQSTGFAYFLVSNRATLIPNHPLLFTFITIISMAAGTSFIMWLGEKVSEHGIGNGISLIIAWGIIAQYIPSITGAKMAIQSEAMAPIWVPIIIVLTIAVSAFIIYFQQASRKIPVQYARRVVGRRQFQGASTFLPLKLNTAGVIPVIFASSILTFPGMIMGFFFPNSGGSLSAAQSIFNPNSRANLYTLFDIQKDGIFLVLKAINLHTVLYTLLTVFFCYFYTAITFNPLDTAENLRKMGGFIPGRQPGKRTADYIDYVLTRVTLVGAFFLVSVAILPQLLSVSFNVPYSFADIAGGTGIIIVVGVMLDTVKQIESQLMMRHYEGFNYRAGGNRRWQFRPSTS